VINAFARIGNADTADDILTKMKLFYERGDDSLKPDTICYSSVIDACELNDEMHFVGFLHCTQLY
jgi:hypothetical protein